MIPGRLPGWIPMPLLRRITPASHRGDSTPMQKIVLPESLVALEALLSLTEDLLPLWRADIQDVFPPTDDPEALRSLRKQTAAALGEQLGPYAAHAVSTRMAYLVHNARDCWEELAVLTMLLSPPNTDAID